MAAPLETFAGCPACDWERAALRADEPPAGGGGRTASIVDLFSGAGGLSAGAKLAAADLGLNLDVALAVETDPVAAAVFEAWSGSPNVRRESVNALFPSDGSNSAAALAEGCDLLVGGPPCQGHSNLNNRTRRADDRNALYFTMASAAARLRPRAVLIENVPGVRHDRAEVLERTSTELRRLQYDVFSCDVKAVQLGVPQKRVRRILLAVTLDEFECGDARRLIETSLAQSCAHTRTLRWAIEDLAHLPDRGIRLLDTASISSSVNRGRMDWLFDNDEYELDAALRPPCHRDNPTQAQSYKTIYGRLNWDTPAQTITTGYGSMGQGRYVHPSKRRTITPHEAARIQTIPDWMLKPFETHGRRGDWARLIGNAVPPLMSQRLVRPLLAELFTPEQAHGPRAAALTTA